MPLTEIQKFGIIVDHNKGKSIRDIANDMNINPKTVNMWITRYKKEGNLNRKQRNGKLREQLNSL